MACIPSCKPASKLPVKRYNILVPDLFQGVDRTDLTGQLPNSTNKQIESLQDYLDHSFWNAGKVSRRLEKKFLQQLKQQKLPLVRITVHSYIFLIASGDEEQAPKFANEVILAKPSVAEQLLTHQDIHMRSLGCELLTCLIKKQTYSLIIEDIDRHMALVAETFISLARSPGENTLLSNQSLGTSRELLSLCMRTIVAYVDLLSTAPVTPQHLPKVIAAVCTAITSKDTSLDYQSTENDDNGFHSYVCSPVVTLDRAYVYQHDQYYSQHSTTRAAAFYGMQRLATMTRDVALGNAIYSSLFEYFDSNNAWVINDSGKSVPVLPKTSTNTRTINSSLGVQNTGQRNSSGQIAGSQNDKERSSLGYDWGLPGVWCDSIAKGKLDKGGDAKHYQAFCALLKHAKDDSYKEEDKDTIIGLIGEMSTSLRPLYTSSALGVTLKHLPALYSTQSLADNKSNGVNHKRTDTLDGIISSICNNISCKSNLAEVCGSVLQDMPADVQQQLILLRCIRIATQGVTKSSQGYKLDALSPSKTAPHTPSLLHDELLLMMSSQTTSRAVQTEASGLLLQLLAVLPPSYVHRREHVHRALSAAYSVTRQSELTAQSISAWSKVLNRYVSNSDSQSCLMTLLFCQQVQTDVQTDRNRLTPTQSLQLLLYLASLIHHIAATLRHLPLSALAVVDPAVDHKIGLVHTPSGLEMNKKGVDMSTFDTQGVLASRRYPSASDWATVLSGCHAFAAGEQDSINPTQASLNSPCFQPAELLPQRAGIRDVLRLVPRQHERPALGVAKEWAEAEIVAGRGPLGVQQVLKDAEGAEFEAELTGMQTISSSQVVLEQTN